MRGGYRPGAGRKKGSVTKNISEMAQIREEARVSGMTPLQVLLHIMRIYFQQEDWDKAAENAARAAPFMHAKLIATQVTLRRPDEMSDDELLSSIAIAESHGVDEAVRGDVPPGAGETRH
jgi:hypothetical protein